MAGVDLPTLAALLGHKSIHMTMRYVHPADEDKREAVHKIGASRSPKPRNSHKAAGQWLQIWLYCSDRTDEWFCNLLKGLVGAWRFELQTSCAPKAGAPGRTTRNFFQSVLSDPIEACASACHPCLKDLGPKADLPFRVLSENQSRDLSEREMRGSFKGAIPVPSYSPSFLFNVFALLHIPCKPLKSLPLLFSIPTAPTNISFISSNL